MSGAFFCSICFEAGSNSAYFFQVNDMCDPVTSPTLLCIFHFRPKCSKELCFLIDLTLHKWKSEVDTSPRPPDGPSRLKLFRQLIAKPISVLNTLVKKFMYPNFCSESTTTHIHICTDPNF